MFAEVPQVFGFAVSANQVGPSMYRETWQHESNLKKLAVWLAGSEWQDVGRL